MRDIDIEHEAVLKAIRIEHRNEKARQRYHARKKKLTHGRDAWVQLYMCK